MSTWSRLDSSNKTNQLPSQHHLRLYIYSFSLQAHMQRAESCNDGRRPLVYFPTGLMGSVDARFIIEAMNAAVR